MTRIIDGRIYLMRDTRTTPELRRLYKDFCWKYRSSMDFHRWLVERGKVYIEIKAKTAVAS